VLQRVGGEEALGSVLGIIMKREVLGSLRTLRVLLRMGDLCAELLRFPG